MDNTTPVTQADFVVLMQRIGDVEVKLDRLGSDVLNDVHDLHEKLETMETQLMNYMDKKTEETKHFFAVVAENLHKNMLGAHKDKISVIDDRSLQNRSRIEVMEKVLAI